jgi:hypothetical protein
MGIGIVGDRVVGPDVLVNFQARLLIQDDDALLGHASEVTGSPVESLDVAISEGVCNPLSAPMSVGYEIVSKQVVQEGRLHLLSIACRVSAPENVIAEAVKVYQACWGDKVWRPAGQQEALYEILVASSANPSPSDVGFEICGLVEVEIDDVEGSSRRLLPHV